VTLLQAERRVRTGYALGYTLMALGLLGLCISMVKYFYFAPPNPLSDPYTFPLRLRIYSLLQTCGPCFFIWKITPTPTLFLQLNAVGNYGVLFLVCIFLLGVLIRNSAWHLNGTIKATRLEVQKFGWARQLLQQQGYVDTTRDLLAVEIQLASRDTWYKRPQGLILLAVTSGVLVQIIRELLLKLW
jgi:hypothetical protein